MENSEKTKFCKHCGATIPADAVMCTELNLLSRNSSSTMQTPTLIQMLTVRSGKKYVINGCRFAFAFSSDFSEHTSSMRAKQEWEYFIFSRLVSAESAGLSI